MKRLMTWSTGDYAGVIHGYVGQRASQKIPRKYPRRKCWLACFRISHFGRFPALALCGRSYVASIALESPRRYISIDNIDPHMSKTPKQEIDDRIEALQLKLIEENAAIGALRPVTLEEFDGTRAQELRQHEGKRDGIKEQIAFLTAKKIQIASTPTHRRGAKTTKQAAVYKEIVKLKKRNPKLSNVEAFELLADSRDDSEDAIRKAFYAEQKKLIEDTARLAREKRDSEGETDQQDGDGK